MSHPYFASLVFTSGGGVLTPDPATFEVQPSTGDSSESYYGWLYPQPHTKEGNQASLSSLLDVSLASPAAGSVLSFNGWQWVAASAPAADISASNIQQLANVSTTSPADGQLLAWDAPTSKWGPVDLGAVTVALAGLSDVTISTPSNGEVLTYNGSEWIAAAPAAVSSGGSGLVIPVTRASDLSLRFFSQADCKATAIPGLPIILDVSDLSNIASVYRYSTTADGTFDSGTEYTTGVTRAGTPGTAGATVTLNVTGETPALFLYDSDAANSAEYFKVILASGLTQSLPTASSDGYSIYWDEASGSYLSGPVVRGLAAGATGGVTIVALGGGDFTLALDLSSHSIDGLSDVDTVTTPPSNGQSLFWNTAGSKWLPGTPYAYTLPTAAAAVLGGVKVGTGLAIDGAGVLSYTLPTAAAAVLGGVKVGTGLAIDAGVLSTTTPALGSVSIDALSDVDTTTAAPSAGQGLVWSAASSKWIPGSVGGAGAAIAATHTTASLAASASTTLDFTAFAQAGMLQSIATSAAAWVVIYNSTAARAADSGRSISTDPSRTSGVVAEVITTGSQTIALSPAIGFANSDGTPIDQLYAKVLNMGAVSAEIGVTLAVIKLM